MTSASASGEVVVWWFDLDDPAPDTGVLSHDERRRAARMRFDVDRNRYERGRATLRHLLADAVDSEPANLMFSYNEQGKPSLSPHLGVHFNLAHSANLAVLAVAPFNVGIDVETIRPGFADDEIAERFFAPSEVTQLRTLPKIDQEAAFFRCWTRKESYLKALGGGLSIDLDAFTVAFADPNEDPAITWVRNEPQEASQWSVVDCSSAITDTAVCALAARCPIGSVAVSQR